MEAQRREAAARETARMEIALRVGAVDGAATPPEATCRLRRVVAVALARGRRSRQGEEGARLVERRAQRRRVHPIADDVEQVAVRPLGRVGPFARRAGSCEPDIERAPAGAVEVARDPVAALAAAMGEIAPTDGLGLGAERGGDAGRVHGAAPTVAMHSIDMKDSSGLGGDTRYRPARPLVGAGGRARSAQRVREAGARADSKPIGKRKGRRAKRRPG